MNIKLIKGKLRLGNWLTILGGITIFSSWVIEKRLEAAWSDEKESLKRSQLVIDITEVNRSIYETAYYAEAAKVQKDTPQLAYLQQRLTRVWLDLLSWSKGRVSDDAKNTSQMFEDKRMIDDDNRNNLLRRNYKAIMNNFNIVGSIFSKDYMALDRIYSAKVDIVLAKEEFWNNAFTILYILGSVLLGLAYLDEKTSTK